MEILRIIERRFCISIAGSSVRLAVTSEHSVVMENRNKCMTVYREVIHAHSVNLHRGNSLLKYAINMHLTSENTGNNGLDKRGCSYASAKPVQYDAR